MTVEEINSLSEEEVLALMRQLDLPVEHSLFCTTHYRSEERPEGFTDADLDEISASLESADLGRWRRQLAEHFSAKG